MPKEICEKRLRAEVASRRSLFFDGGLLAELANGEWWFRPTQGQRWGSLCCGGAFSGVAKPEGQKHARTVLEGMFPHNTVPYFSLKEYSDECASWHLQTR